MHVYNKYPLIENIINVRKCLKKSLKYGVIYLRIDNIYDKLIQFIDITIIY